MTMTHQQRVTLTREHITRLEQAASQLSNIPLRSIVRQILRLALDNISLSRTEVALACVAVGDEVMATKHCGHWPSDLSSVFLKDARKTVLSSIQRVIEFHHHQMNEKGHCTKAPDPKDIQELEELVKRLSPRPRQRFDETEIVLRLGASEKERTHEFLEAADNEPWMKLLEVRHTSDGVNCATLKVCSIRASVVRSCSVRGVRMSPQGNNGVGYVGMEFGVFVIQGDDDYPQVVRTEPLRSDPFTMFTVEVYRGDLVYVGLGGSGHCELRVSEIDPATLRLTPKFRSGNVPSRTKIERWFQ